jgi:iron complex outermembrane receptor protein
MNLRLSIWFSIAGFITFAAPSEAQIQADAEPIIVQATASDTIGAPTQVPVNDFSGSAFAPTALARVPNAVGNEAGASSFEDVYSVRGLTNTPNFSKQALTIYVDGVPSSSTFANFPEEGMIERAVIFHGPQGDFFGKNSEAGLLQITTQQPHSFQLMLEGSGGNYEMGSGHALLATPLWSETAFLSFEGSYFARDGFLENTLRETHPDFQRHAFGRFYLRVVPAPDSEITFSSELHKINDGVQRFVPLSAPDPFRVAFDFDGRTDISGNVESLRIAHSLDFGKLTLITSWRDWKLAPYEADFDYSPVPFVRGRIVLEQEQLAQEIRLDSREDQVAWRWRVGVFSDRVASDGSEAFLFQQFSKVISFDDHNYEAAIFGRSTWQVGANLEFTVGTRLEYNDESITRTRVVTFVPTPPRFDGTRNEWNVQPRLALTYNYSPQVSTFIDSTYGYKSGGFSYLETDPRLARFDTERVWANELGVRAETRDKRCDVRAVVFVDRIEDYQVERPAIPPDLTIFNAPLAVSRGAEIEASARPVEGIELCAAAGYTRSEFRDFHDPFTGVSYRGKRTPFTPEFTVTASARYKWRGVFVQSEILAAGESFYDEANTRALREGPHAQFNARIGYEHDRFALTFFCDNLSDERYFTEKISSAGVGTPAPPRTFGGSFALKF